VWRALALEALGREFQAALLVTFGKVVLILVNIDDRQYPAQMKRATDPTVLIFLGAADPTRLPFLGQLAAGDGVCACDLTDCCDVAQPTVSHHLKVVRDTGWVRIERRGSFIYSFVLPEAIGRFRAIAGDLVPVSPMAATRALPVIQQLA
jgi:ArsR family transcriptional regulator, arsenate/arsenite/antimonite-responsive transcriptional repressor